jgi:predicted acetyltransferase
MLFLSKQEVQMCLDGNWLIPDAHMGEQVGLRSLPIVSAEGYRYSPRHAFRAQTGVPGVVYDMTRESDGAKIGSVMLLLSSDENAVMHVGHMGCEVLPAHRKQGHVTRIANAMAPLLWQRGIDNILIGADVGHASQYQSILNAGAKFLGDNFAAGLKQCGARFRLTKPSLP